MPKKQVLIIAGEPSGDLHASRVVNEIKKISADTGFYGLGGKLMSEAGVRIIHDISGLAFIGITEVLRNILVIKGVYQKVLREIDAKRPDLAILVDYPGFNLRIAKELKKRNIPVAYYISPQLWAWGEDRIRIIKDTVAKMVVFFKFEEEFYRRRGVAVEFVGHPLLESVRPTLAKEEALKRYGLDPAGKTVALLPGSRKTEVENHLPCMLEAAGRIARRVEGARFIVAKFPDLPAELYKREIEKYPLDVKLIEGDTYNVLNAADLAIVASGTATLETAIIGTPMVIMYKTSLLTYIAFRLVAKIRNVGLVNVIAGEEVSPEFLQVAATVENISEEAVKIISSPDRIRKMKEAFSRVRSSLGSPGSYSRAASAILSC